MTQRHLQRKERNALTWASLQTRLCEGDAHLRKSGNGGTPFTMLNTSARCWLSPTAAHAHQERSAALAGNLSAPPSSSALSWSPTSNSQVTLDWSLTPADSSLAQPRACRQGRQDRGS